MKKSTCFNHLLMTALAGAMLFAFIAPAGAFAANVKITEWMYKGEGGEFVEFTNLGDTAVDFTGWFYNDSHAIDDNPFDLSGFGMVAAGESVILTEDPAMLFRTDWGLDQSVKIIGGLGDGDAGNNIGGSDTINLYNAAGSVVDTLTYEKGTIAAKGASGNPGSVAALGADDDSLWVLAHEGDVFGSWASGLGDLGNPGTYNPVPVPGAFWLMGAGILALSGLKRKED